MIHRTAVYAIRTYGGVGGGSREASSYPDRTAPIQPWVNNSRRRNPQPVAPQHFLIDFDLRPRPVDLVL